MSASLTFLLIHALVGQPPEEDLVGGVVRVDSYADASGDVEHIAVDMDGLTQRAIDALGGGLRDPLCRLVAGQVGGDDDELVPTQACERVRRTDSTAQIFGDLPKQLIADIVAVGVVDEFEPVEIDHE